MVATVKTSEASSGADRRLRVGVLGAGVMGSNHARVFMGLPDVELVGIADPLDAHRQRSIDLIGCRTFADTDALRRATVAAALCCTGRGAQPSIPTAGQTDEALLRDRRLA